MSQVVRWLQRLDSFRLALGQLNDAVTLSQSRELSLLEKQGLVQAFEFSHELAWKMIKDYLEFQGYTGISGSRDAFRTAFKNGLIDDGDLWMESINARNITSHTYSAANADLAVSAIINDFAPLFNRLLVSFESLTKNVL